MVDALRRAHQIVEPGGCLVDLHPTTVEATVEVGARRIGRIDAGDAPARHAAAGVALASAVGEGLFTVEAEREFTFYTYADSIDELREYVEDNWRNARIGPRTVERVRQALREAPGERPRSLEHVTITRLRALPG